MGWGRALRRDHGGTAGAGPAFLAIALAVVVVATEVPLEDAVVATPSLAPGQAELSRALDEDLSRVERLLQDSWGGANASLELPVVRARVAADSLAATLQALYPREVRGKTMELAEVRITVDELAEDPIPGDVGVRLAGVLRAASGLEHRLARAFDLEARDPYHGRSTQFLLETLDDQAEDPQSEVAAAVRGRLVVVFASLGTGEPGVLDYEISQALRAAAAEVERRLGLARGADEAEIDDAPTSRSSAAFASPDLGDLLGALNDSAFVTFLEGYLLRDGAPWAVVSFVDALLAWRAPVRDAAIAALRESPNAFAALLSRWAPSNSTLLRHVADLFVRAARELGASARVAAGRAALWLAAMNPPAPPVPSSGSNEFVQFRASHARLVTTRFWAPMLSRAGFVLPFCANALVEFTLHVEAAIPLADGSIFKTTQMRLVRLEVPYPAAGPLAQSLLAPPLEALGGDRWMPAIDGVADAFSLLESLRREVDARAWKFRDAVARKTAEGSAGTFSRLLFRVLNALEDGDKNGVARGLFDFLERYVADELRDALTVNFTVLGVNLTLIPDPVRQQVSLQHARGPHTFGVRLRRIPSEESPLVGKFNDPLSLALEIYYRYSKPPIDAGLVIDPFMRTDEGLLRFFVRSTAGDGILIQIASPRFVRRAGVFELSLADLLPGLGGIPLAVTPTGGILVANVGARVEIGAPKLTTVAKWVLRAAEAAWLDTVANESVSDAAAELGIPRTARKLFERFLNRFADIAAAQASRALTRADLFLRISDREAGGLVSSSFEAALSIREPLVVLRELTSDLASLFRLALTQATSPRPPAPGLLDFLPSAVHERVGLSLKVSARGGLGEFLLFPGSLKGLPDATVSQELYLSAGSLATLFGRAGVHWVCEYTIAWDGLSKKIPNVSWRVGKNDSVELVHVRMEGLSGPKILISEVSPVPGGDDSDLEFVELYNPGFAEETLTGWALVDAGGRRYHLPPGTRIAAGGILLIARSAAPFFARYAVAPDAPSLTLALNDEGDQVRLINDRGILSDEVAWGSYSAVGLRVHPEESVARLPAQRPPVALPGSALAYTGSESDFAVGAATPGRLPN